MGIFDQSLPGTVTFEGNEYTLDRYGFLDAPQQWDEDFARGIADQVLVPTLTDEHWAFIRYVRRQFLEKKTVPLVVFACMETKTRLSRLRYLFPTGYHLGVCRIAGINYAFLKEDNLWHTMETAHPPQADYVLDDLGFLEDFNRWNERFAWLVGRELGLTGNLTERHLAVLRTLRERYRETSETPTLHETCRAHGLGLSEFHDLFPGGYRRGACRMAGLPFLH